MKDRDRILNEFQNEKEDIRIKTRKDYETFDHMHNQVCLFTYKISSILYLGKTKFTKSTSSMHF